MKKGLLIMISLLALLVVSACSSSDYAGESGAAEPEEKNTEKTTAEPAETEKQKEEEAEPSLEIAQSTDGSWKDSIDSVWIHSSAIFKNTGDVPVEIGETQMNFKGTDGSILGTAPMIYAVPTVVAPGETAFVSESTVLEGTTDPAQYKETTYNFGFDKTDKEANLLETSGVKGIKGDEYQPYSVTGVVTNRTDELQDDIRLAAGLFAEDGSLLGVLTGSVNVGINPDGEAGFELNYPELPAGTADKVAEIEVKAYGWKF